MIDDVHVRFAEERDLPYLRGNDRSIDGAAWVKKVSDRQAIVAVHGERPVASLRFGLWWDSFPCMHLIVVEEGYRGRGVGRKLAEHWEREMKARGHKFVMTTTDADGEAQHFHRKLGYRDCGCLIFPEGLFPEHTLEILFVKVLD
jgi:GNAT superfamily N-acetyltransferase